MDELKIRFARVSISDLVDQYFPKIGIVNNGKIESLVLLDLVETLYPNLGIGWVEDTKVYQAVLFPTLGKEQSVVKSEELVIAYPLTTWTVSEIDEYAEQAKIERPESETFEDNIDLGLEEHEFEILRNHFRGLGYW